MTSPSRSAQFGKLHKLLKKFYSPVSPNLERPVLEQLLYAGCLENAPYEKADEAYAALVHTFFDWNEIRVTTVKELADVMAVLPDPAAAAQRVKRSLQSVFEASYSFDLEELRKKNLGAAVERLEKIAGASRFTVGYVIQTALGGHAIPLDAGALGALQVLGYVTDKEVQEGAVSGLERAIPKNKGLEFGSLLHRLSADFVANPYSTTLHKTLVQIEPSAQERLPKRRPKETKPEPVPAAPTKGKGAKPEPAPAGAAASDDEKSKAKKRKKGDEPEAAAPAGKGPGKTAAEPKAAEKAAEKPASRSAEKPSSKAVEKPVETKPAKAAGKPAAESKAAASGKTDAKKKAPAPAGKKGGESALPTGAAKRTAAGGLSKRKPR